MKHKVNSTSIVSVEETGRGTMIVEFVNRGRYEYFDVPRDVVEAFVQADSAGKFFNENIRGQYHEEKRS